ncbi:hypothetical protein AAG570_013935 [Ranatra chinensis]|uniref:Sox developmental protein N-terminal domain-containing protein n=1 Tax=Ranatra chinensis TaxID=642074 RepID=A0ABD0YDK9_9HEMI
MLVDPNRFRLIANLRGSIGVVLRAWDDRPREGLVGLLRNIEVGRLLGGGPLGKRRGLSLLCGWRGCWGDEEWGQQTFVALSGPLYRPESFPTAFTIPQQTFALSFDLAVSTEESSMLDGGGGDAAGGASARPAVSITAAGGASARPVVSITASAAASVAAAAKAAIARPHHHTNPNNNQLDNPHINEAVSKVLQGYDWTLVPVVTNSIPHAHIALRIMSWTVSLLPNESLDPGCSKFQSTPMGLSHFARLVRRKGLSYLALSRDTSYDPNNIAENGD